jgi:hypothetical protein
MIPAIRLSLIEVQVVSIHGIFDIEMNCRLSDSSIDRSLLFDVTNAADHTNQRRLENLRELSGFAH